MSTIHLTDNDLREIKLEVDVAREDMGATSTNPTLDDYLMGVAIGTTLRIVETRVSRRGRKNLGESCLSSDLSGNLQGGVPHPSRASASEALQEALLRLFGIDEERSREGSADDLKRESPRSSEVRVLRIEDVEAVPDELKKIVAMFEKVVGDFPDLRAHFLKGLSKGIKALGGDELER